MERAPVILGRSELVAGSEAVSILSSERILSLHTDWAAGVCFASSL